MNKLIYSLGVLLFCFAASAQPTSFGGVTPGRTTLAELKGLVEPKDIKELEGEKVSDGFASVTLKQAEGKSISVSFQNDVVYKLDTILSFEPELKQGLLAKYGRPKIKIGGIKSVICKNGYGAAFQRWQGQARELWPIRDGVQGEIRYLAEECAEAIFASYVLKHVATVSAIEKKEAEDAISEAGKRLKKLEGAL